MGRLFYRALSWFQNQPRPAQLLMTVLLTVLVLAGIDAINGWVLWQSLFYPPRATVADVRFWSALVYAMALVMGLPVAFLIWHWRDKNVRDQIENARKDVILKEFQEIQRHASGLFDSELDKKAKMRLQIAALHQLCDFLAIDQPESFRRAAFELIWPSEGVSEFPVKSFREWVRDTSDEDQQLKDYWQYTDDCFDELDIVAHARISIINDNWEQYFHSDFPLVGRDFSFLRLPRNANLSHLDFSECRFIRASLQRVNFDHANMKHCVLDRIFGQGASFVSTTLSWSAMNFSGLGKDNSLEFFPHQLECDFTKAHMEGVYLDNTVMCHANISGASILAVSMNGFDLNLATLNFETNFRSGYSISNDDLTGHKILLSMGAKFDSKSAGKGH